MALHREKFLLLPSHEFSFVACQCDRVLSAMGIERGVAAALRGLVSAMANQWLSWVAGFRLFRALTAGDQERDLGLAFSFFSLEKSVRQSLRWDSNPRNHLRR